MAEMDDPFGGLPPRTIDPTEIDGEPAPWWLAALGFLVIAVLIVGVLAIFGLAIRVLWTVGSRPEVAAQFFKMEFLQASSGLFAAIGAIALVVVTWSLVRATSKLQAATAAQTHAQTAPLMLIGAATYEDPLLATDAPKDVAAYPYESEDRKEQEYLAFLNGVTPDAPKRYLAVSVSNLQDLASFAVATDVAIKVVLRFTKLSTVRAGTKGLVEGANSVKIERVLRIPAVLGKDIYWLPAFRVDPLPYWGYEIERIVYRNFQGRHRGFGVGQKAGAWTDRGLVTQTDKFPPLMGEVPE